MLPRGSQSRAYEGYNPTGSRHTALPCDVRELPHLAFPKSYGDFLRPAHRQRRNPRRRGIQHISDEATQQGGLAAFGSRNRRQARRDLVGNPKRDQRHPLQSQSRCNTSLARSLSCTRKQKNVPVGVGSNQYSLCSGLAPAKRSTGPALSAKFCPQSPFNEGTIANPDPPAAKKTNALTNVGDVDRDFPAACGLTTALWGARSAFGCCANAPSFGWESRSVGTRR